MAELLTFVLSASGAVVGFLVCAVMLLLFPRAVWVRRITMAVAVGYAGASVYVVPALLTRVWASGYGPLRGSASAPNTAIVLLGSGEEQIYGWSDPWSVMNQTETERVVETARVFRLISPTWIVSSGGGPSYDPSARPSSEAMREALIQLGVPASRILSESTSRDTHDEAVLIAPMLRARDITNVVLVTSAVHMRRSLGAFRAAGVSATPAVAPASGPARIWYKRLLPSGEGLEASAQLAHELVGLPYYWLRGWYR
jgi:uncharacterized SAM-binding protein YcdF (DUF218 family)